MDLNEIIERPQIPLESSIKVGAATAEWFELENSNATILVEGGSISDRQYAHQWLSSELAYHGYRLAEIHLPDQDLTKESSFQVTADWNAVMSKAKRLLDSGNVHLLRNGYNYIVANVQGDHGNYEVEISRQDPNSRVITGWSCTCAYAQFAFDRTRKFKKIEGRPDSHVLATYWKSLATPLDDAPEGESPSPGQRVSPLPGQPAPGQTPGQAGEGGDSPPIGMREPISPQRTFLPDEGGPQPGPMNMQQAPSPIQQTPIAPSQGVIPPFPGAQMQQWESWQGPGTTDGGQESPPWAVSVPGAKPTTPFNPLQWPGTYSNVKEADWIVESSSYQAGDVVQLVDNVYMNTDPSLQGNWQMIPARKPNGQPQLASVRDVDPQTGFIQIWISMDANGPLQVPYAYAYVDPSEIKPSQSTNDPTAPRRVYK